MNNLAKAGLGVVLIGLAFALPFIEIFGIAFGQIDRFILLIVQIGMILTGLGYMVGDE